MASLWTREKQAQIDGRFWITETHTLSDGSVQSLATLCDPKTDIDALVLARDADLEAAIVFAKDPATLTATALDLKQQATALNAKADDLLAQAAVK